MGAEVFFLINFSRNIEFFFFFFFFFFFQIIKQFISRNMNLVILAIDKSI